MYKTFEKFNNSQIPEIPDITNIPNEILLKVFRYLSISDLKYSILFVCKTWRDISEDPTLWTNVKAYIRPSIKFCRDKLLWTSVIKSLSKRRIHQLSFDKRYISMKEALNFTYMLGENVTSVVFTGYDAVDAADAWLMPCHTPNLQSLIFHGQGISFEDLENWNVRDKWAKLRNISLPSKGEPLNELNHQNSEDIYTERIIKFFTKFEVLESISLSGYQNISYMLLKNLLLLCQKLSHLDISHTAASDKDVSCLYNSSTTANRLVSLNLNNCRNLDTTVPLIIKHQSESLTTLQLQHVEVNTETCEAISQLKSIEKLDFGNCHTMTGHHFLIMKPVLPQLRSLMLRSCLQLNKSSFLSCFKTVGLHHHWKLRNVNLGGCSALKNESLWLICSNCKFIESLDISSCTGVSDLGLYKVYKNLNSLKSLKLKWCISISDQGINGYCSVDNDPSALLDNATGISTLSRLQELDISYCAKLTNAVCYSLNGLVSLVTLSMNGLKNVNDDGIKSLSQQLRSLEFLSISSCTKVTDSGIITAIKNMPRLCSLDISKCPCVTDEAVRNMQVYCKNLRYLNACFCKAISSKSINDLQYSLHLVNLGASSHSSSSSSFVFDDCVI